jgi:hypothetical protein
LVVDLLPFVVANWMLQLLAHFALLFAQYHHQLWIWALVARIVAAHSMIGQLRHGWRRALEVNSLATHCSFHRDSIHQQDHNHPECSSALHFDVVSMMFSHIEDRDRVPPLDGLPHVTHAKAPLRVLSIWETHRRSRALCCNAQYVAGPPGTPHQYLAGWGDVDG